MTLPQEPERAFARVERNVTAGRDFVVGDVHGEFDTLEAMLASVGFRPGRDRLFALGDLVDRGPRSADALAWMENGQIELSVRGNHEQMLLDRIDAAESDREGRTPRTAHPLGMAHPWFARNVERSSWAKWKAMIRSMPFAATVGTRAGPIGLVHATPTSQCWEDMLAKLVERDSDTIWMALTSTARARNDARRAEQEGVPLGGRIEGVRAVLTGHAIVDEVTTTVNVWHIDTGAGFRNGRLTLARIDTDPIETLTVGTAPAR